MISQSQFTPTMRQVIHPCQKSAHPVSLYTRKHVDPEELKYWENVKELATFCYLEEQDVITAINISLNLWKKRQDRVCVKLLTKSLLL